MQGGERRQWKCLAAATAFMVSCSSRKGWVYGMYKYIYIYIGIPREEKGFLPQLWFWAPNIYAPKVRSFYSISSGRCFAGKLLIWEYIAEEMVDRKPYKYTVKLAAQVTKMARRINANHKRNYKNSRSIFMTSKFNRSVHSGLYSSSFSIYEKVNN